MTWLEIYWIEVLFVRLLAETPLCCRHFRGVWSVGNRSSTSYDNLTLLNIYDAEATAGRLATCCWQHWDAPAEKKSTERKDPLVSLVLSLDLARKTGLSGSCVVGFPFWGRRWLRNCCSNRRTRSCKPRIAPAPIQCIIYVWTGDWKVS